jgi:hypothetical protein
LSPNPFETERRFNSARTRLDTLGLKAGQQFEYLFDFGDSWWHEVTVDQVGQVVSGRRYPVIVEKHGRSPAQYGRAEARRACRDEV